MSEEEKPWKRSGSFVYQLNEKGINAWSFNVQDGKSNTLKNEAIAKQIVDEHVAVAALVKVCEDVQVELNVFLQAAKKTNTQAAVLVQKRIDQVQAAIALTKKDAL